MTLFDVLENQVFKLYSNLYAWKADSSPCFAIRHIGTKLLPECNEMRVFALHVPSASLNFLFLSTGKVSSIRHLKNEVDTIKNGVECGIALSDLSVEPEPGDTLVCFRMIQVAQKSEWDPGF